jgi:glycosyltransferase involved in cell wall biosynthesis
MLWYDVTDILEWRGVPPGAIRMQLELARYLLEGHTGIEVKLCKFKLGKIIDVDINSIRGHMRRFGRTEQRNKGEKTTALITQSLKDLYYRTFGRALASRFSLLHKMLMLIWGLVGFIVRFLLNVLRKAKRIIQGISVEMSDRKRVIDLEPGDVYLSLAKDWDCPGKLVSVYKLRISGIKTMLFCRDMAPILFPHLDSNVDVRTFPEYFCNLAWAADSIICSSESTRRDFDQFTRALGSPTPRLIVCMPGSDHQLLENERSPLDELKNSEFILFVSTIERRKNHETIYKAYVELRSRGVRNIPKCVFVGIRGSGTADVVKDIELDPRVKDLFMLVERVSESELEWLYRHSLFTVFPSLYEGWGLSVAESLACGTPVLASDNLSLREVGGDFAEYIEAWDYKMWADRIRYYSLNREKLDSWRERIRNTYAGNKWTTSCETIISEVHNLIDQSAMGNCFAAQGGLGEVCLIDQRNRRY